MVAVQRDVLANDVRPAFEPRLPERVRQHDVAIGTPTRSWAGSKNCPAEGLQPQHAEVVRADQFTIDALGARIATQTERRRVEPRRVNAGKSPNAVAEVRVGEYDTVSSPAIPGVRPMSTSRSMSSIPAVGPGRSRSPP